MQHRTLGRTGLRVSLLGYGTGGPSLFGRHAGLSAEGQKSLIRRCLELGINFFDTAEEYDQSEESLGRALRGVSRDAYILSTKWAHHVDVDSLKEDPEELVLSVERSLSRLGTDYIDVMQFHGVLEGHYAGLVSRFYPVMKRLQAQGKIRFIGLTEVLRRDPKHEAVSLALRSHPELWDVVMFKYGILNQWAAKQVLPLAQQHNVGVINMAPVRLSLTRPAELATLLSEWRREGIIPKGELCEADPLGWLVRDGVDSIVSAGYKFAADHPAISTVLTGTSSVHHLELNAAAMERPGLPAADTRRLVALFGDCAATR